MLQSLYEIGRDSDRYPVYWECSDPRCLPHFHNSLELAYAVEGKTEAMMAGPPALVTMPTRLPWGTGWFASSARMAFTIEVTGWFSGLACIT